MDQIELSTLSDEEIEKLLRVLVKDSGIGDINSLKVNEILSSPEFIFGRTVAKKEISEIREKLMA